MTTVIVVEPNALLRQGILHLLSDFVPTLILKWTDYSFLMPEPQSANDLVVLSLPASETECLIEAAQRACKPRSMLLLVEDHFVPSETLHWPRCVCGYLLKSVNSEVFRASIRVALTGGSCFPLKPAGEVRSGPFSDIKPTDTVASSHSKTSELADLECRILGLTPRQYEVLSLLAQGLSMKRIARSLTISPATGKSHAEAIYQRLEVHSRIEAIHAAVSRGATLGRFNP